MITPPGAVAPEKPWKRITKLALWLYLMTPVGLWKLYKDPDLSSSAKWRILIYLFLLPTLAYAAISISIVSRSFQRLLP